MNNLSFFEIKASLHPFRWSVNYSSYKSRWDNYFDKQLTIGPITIDVCIPFAEHKPTQPHDTPKVWSGHKTP